MMPRDAIQQKCCMCTALTFLTYQLNGSLPTTHPKRMMQYFKTTLVVFPEVREVCLHRHYTSEHVPIQICNCAVV